MKFIISPAKNLSLDTNVSTDIKTTPHFIKKAEVLNAVLKKKSAKDLRQLMDINQKLAEQNWERNQNWNPNPNEFQGLQAFLLFKGEVYRGLDAETIPDNCFDYLQHNLKILSGLYGLLNAFDFIMPYRLEMGIPLQVKTYKNLYQFWGDSITTYLNDLSEKDEPIINLSSHEYCKAVKTKKLKGRWIDIDFKEERDGKLKSIVTYMKHARGSMVRLSAVNKIERAEDLKSLIVDDYIYREEISTDSKWIFVKG